MKNVAAAFRPPGWRIGEGKKENGNLKVAATLFLLGFVIYSSCGASIIQNTRIQRVGRDIEISWAYNPLQAADQVDVWVLAGKKIEFDKTPSRYLKVNTVKGTSYKDIYLKTGDSQNCYYRIVPRATAQKNIFDPEINDRTVAKFDLELKKGLNLVTIPLLPQGRSRLEDLIGEQLGNGGSVIYFDNRGKDFRRAVYLNGVLKYDKLFTISAGNGFFVKTQNNSAVTFVGEATDEVKYTIYEGNNLLGNSTPQTKEITKDLFMPAYADTAASPQDALYSFNPSSKGILVEDSFVFNREFLLTPGCGFWYQRKNAGLNIYPSVLSSYPSGTTFQILPENAIQAKKGSVIQFIASNAPPNDRGDHLSDGKLIFSGVVGGGIPLSTEAYGTFNYFIDNCTGEVYVRVWNSNDISGSVRGKRYATLGPFNAPSAPSAPAVFNLPSFHIKNLCAAPDSISVKVEKIFMKSHDNKMEVALTVVPVPSKESVIEPASNPKKFRFKFKRAESESWECEYMSDGPLTIVGDDFFRPGGLYEVVGTASNYFGTSRWEESRIISFKIPKWLSIIE